MEKEIKYLHLEANNLKQNLKSVSQVKESLEKERQKQEVELLNVKRELAEQSAAQTHLRRFAETIDELKQYVYPLSQRVKVLLRLLTFFSHLTDIENKVKILLSRSAKENAAGADTDYLMLMWSKYAVKKSEIPIAKWELLLNDIKEKGIITDRALIGYLDEGKNDDQKWNILNERLYKEVYLRWLSAILVLLEEVRNLERFVNGVPTRLAGETRNFEGEIATLRQQALQLFGITVHYVPLFQSYTQYTDVHIKAVEAPVYPFYKDLRLERDFICQIISYGLKSQYGNEPTTVILAK